MCGILGFDGEFDKPLLLSGLRALRHRGPDNSGLYLDETGCVGLGHTRLSIVDLSPLGNQPMLSTDEQVVLVFNGEIYNFQELRRELESEGTIFRGYSDTEVLLHMYLKLGEAMLPRLNGIFAFAVWDKRSGKLLLAKDGMGVKPLYFSESPRGFVFASELKALHSFLNSDSQLDTLSLYRYLSFLWCPGDGTPLASVRKLGPGEAMLVKKGRIEKRWNWYSLPVFSISKAGADQNNWIQGTVSGLRKAVQRQMIADVPVGAFLSGGLDSSAVVAFAREINPDIRCFTVEMRQGQEDGFEDDLPYARRVAQHLNIPLEIVTIDAKKMAQDLERMVVQLDEPLGDPAPLNVLYISQLARQQGVKVLLSGAGGDDLFTGYRRHHAISMEKYWRWLPASIRWGLEHGALQLDQRRALGRRLAKLFNGATLDGNVSIASYFFWTRKEEALALFTPEIRAQLQNQLPEQPLKDFLDSMPRGLSRLDQALLLEQRFFLADHNLIYTDKMSMAAGVEVRVPFLDSDLVEFAAGIPLKFKQRGSTGKWILKKAMEPYLPHEIIYRPKTGFGAPLRRWMRHDLREFVGDMLSEESLKRRNIFEPSAVQKMIADNDSGSTDASYTLFSLLCIEIWARHFIDCGKVD